MCGILCTVSQCSCKKLEENIKPLLCRRGPDYFGQREVNLQFPPTQNHERVEKQEIGGSCTVRFLASVLHLRGDSIAKQPVQDDNDNILAWNGEIFCGLKVSDDDSDTTVLLKSLQCLSGDAAEQIFNTVGVIEGPWSFVYYQARQHTLWFGRDYFGRRSLLWHLPSSSADPFTISSIGKRQTDDADEHFWKEVPADGIYCLDLRKLSNYFLDDNTQEFLGALTRYPWQHASSVTDASVSLGPRCPVSTAFNKVLPTIISTSLPSEKYVTSNEIRGETVDCSLKHSDLRDCTREEVEERDRLPNTTVIQSMERCSSNTRSESERRTDNSDPQGETHTGVFIQDDEIDQSVSTGLQRCHIDQSLVEKFVSILTEAVRKRVFNLPRKNQTELCCKNVCENTSSSCQGQQHNKRSRVGILFSGGLDSIVLAALTDRCVPPDESIDLINVAFEQKTIKKTNVKKRTNKNQQDKKDDFGTCTTNFNVPDRITGRNGIAELKTINPERSWKFVEVNVALQELQEERAKFITHLVYPQSTVLDDSIGCALWFAARGSGNLTCQKCLDIITVVQTSCSHLPLYTSSAKVLLVGMGADEQLGGYARHRSRFNKDGWKGLIEEMEMEVRRISERNLGRDDRCVSDHGREARYPFLDENVVSFLNGLPVWVKCDPRLVRGVGEKIILRQAARFIGLTRSSELPKRAIQFGSRIAKLESSTEKGSEKCRRL